MIKDIVKDQFFLSQKSSEVAHEDLHIIEDLKDTLTFHREHCVGMAANMIGYQKRMMIVNDEGQFLILINPSLIQKQGSYQTQEGCLSLEGVRDTKRYQKIKVDYFDENMKHRIKTFTGYTAQIIQHELDHFEGILI